MLYNTSQEVDICYTMGYAFVYASPTSVFEVILEMDYSETQTPLLWRETYKLPEGHRSPCPHHISYYYISCYHLLLLSLTTILYYHLSLTMTSYNHLLLSHLTTISYFQSHLTIDSYLGRPITSCTYRG
jgi:hypothetical protein